MSVASVLEEMENLNREIIRRGIYAVKDRPIPPVKTAETRPAPVIPEIPATPRTYGNASALPPLSNKWGGTDPYTENTPDDCTKQRAYYRDMNYKKRSEYINECLEKSIWLNKEGILAHVTVMSDAHLANTIVFIERKLDMQEKPIWGTGELWLPKLLKEAELRLENEGAPSI